MKPTPTSLLQTLKLLGKGVAFQKTNGLQQINTQYNIRGWLTQINDINALGNDLFAFKINYNNPDANFVGDALYNGNISQTHWRSQNNNTINRYGYSYDGLNRLLHADYTSGTSVNSNGRYNETLQYDKNGNITQLHRRGSHNIFNELIDQLSYSYIGNQLQNVTDSTIANEAAGFIDGNIGTATNPDYSYDNFGNMIVDKNKKITAIKYNHLNLPLEIVFNNNSQTKINYTYNASGIKISKDARLGLNENGIIQSSSTEYLGGYQYNNGVLQFFPQAQGYIKHNINPNTTASEFDYVYQYKDHLGNIRINYTFDTASSSLKVLEENHYYPFGLKHTASLNKRDIVFEKELQLETAPWIKTIELVGDVKKGIIVPNSGYSYRYQSQERQDELGLNWDSFKWRNYSPDLGRFWVIDPLSEKYAYQSHYNFSENRVIDGRELEGLEWENFRTTGANPGSLKMKLPSTEAQRQHYSITVDNSKKSFSDFKTDFKEGPQKFLTNSKAEFNAPVDGNGKSANFEKGNFIKIDIDGPMNNAFVKVVGLEDKKDKLTTTFATMEGHMEKGKITFRLQENKDGSIKFSIDSQSEVDMGLAPVDLSRDQQQQSWKEVLTNISRYLGGEETKREVKIIEPKNKK